MGQVLRDMDKQQTLIDEAIRINALAEDNDVTPLNLGPLARMSVQTSLRKLSEKLSEVIVALGGEPLPPIGPLKDYGAAIITLNTNIVAAEILNDADKVPEQFTFTDATDADPETLYESDAIVVAGIDAPSPMTITGGEYQIDGGAWASSETTVEDGASIKVRATSSADPETAVNVVLTIGGVSDTYTVTTAAEGGEPELPDPVATANFSSGVYEVEGTPAVLGDIFVEDPENWGTFTPGAVIIPLTGLTDPGGQDANIVINTALAADFIADGVSIVVTFSKSEAGSIFIVFVDFPDFMNDNTFDVLHAGTNSCRLVPPGLPNVVHNADVSNGQHKAGITFLSDGTMSISLDGAEASTTAGVITSALTNIVMALSTPVITIMEFYSPALSDSDLAIATTP